MIPIGLTLQPEERYLGLLEGLIREDCDYYEVSPETLWRPTDDGRLEPNAYHRRFEDLKRESGRAFVAHGTGFSLGSARPDLAERRLWLECVRHDREVFDYLWYTDHLGASSLDGKELTLPLPLPMTPAMVRLVQASLALLQREIADVGLENSVFYYHLGDPLAEPDFLSAILEAPRTHLLLDLHNVYTTACNAGFEAWEYIERLPLAKVIEIHLSGGSPSEAAWLRSQRVLRLDSHDAAVPEEVWRLFERVLPRCPNLRGVTLERMEGTVSDADVPILRAELQRARSILGGSRAVGASRVG